MAREPYPEWFYYPSHSPAPRWVWEFVAVVAQVRATIDWRMVDGLTSDVVLRELRLGLQALGYVVESGKRKEQRV